MPIIRQYFPFIEKKKKILKKFISVHLFPRYYKLFLLMIISD